MPARFPLPLPWALLVAATTLACGDNGNEPDLVLYQLAATQVDADTLQDGTIRVVYQTTVTDGGNLRIAGAWMLFAVTAGDVAPQTDRTDLTGNGRVEWTLDPEDYAGISTATLSGCAQNLAPPDCAPEPLASLSFD